MPYYKTINDPIYGLIEVPEGLLLELIEHPIYQRLRRIQQLGFTQYVYPGATHHRYNHALGAMFLMQKVLLTLKQKGVDITEEEAEAACAAILLHDIGHGPFSHSLEHVLLDIDHEVLSLEFMKVLNNDLAGRLDLAIEIFEDKYPKKFLHQLVSGQLDMDRLDYLTRDSFFTGVTEGKVGYNRLLQLLYVVDDELVIEAKGVYSIESFLIARRLMYWQVYLHKTVVAAGDMLIQLLQRVRELYRQGHHYALPPSLNYFLRKKIQAKDLLHNKKEVLKHFHAIDDTDIWAALKILQQQNDKIVSYLARAILERRIHKMQVQNSVIPEQLLYQKRKAIAQSLQINPQDAQYLCFTGKLKNSAYQTGNQEINFHLGQGKVEPISNWREYQFPDHPIIKHYIAFPLDFS